MGNSITHNGEFHHNVLLYHITRFQYVQALNVRNMLSELWQMEAALRRIRFIGYNRYFKESPHRENLSLLKTHLDSVFTVKYKNLYFNSQLEKYITDKPRQKEYEKASEKLRKEAYQLAQPLDRVFRITGLSTRIHADVDL